MSLPVADTARHKKRTVTTGKEDRDEMNENPFAADHSSLKVMLRSHTDGAAGRSASATGYLP